MKSRVHTVVTLALILPFLGAAMYYFAQTVSLQHLDTTLFTLNLDQIHYLLLMVVCLILLYERTDYALQVSRIHQVFRIGLPQTVGLRALTWVWRILGATLALFGFIVPLLDLLGSIPFSTASGPALLAPKISLLLLTSVYIYELFQRGPGEAKLVSEIVHEAGFAAIMNREQDHAFMSDALDNFEPEAEVFVTHFEEPRNPMQQVDDYVFYYEKSFMEKWYDTIRAKRLRVTQIVLVNSDQDIEDLERRLEVVRNLPNYAIAYLLAPPLTVFFDFMVAPGQFALIGLSDDRSMRNMDVFSIVLHGGPGVTRMARLFTDILVPEARFIKTFEGVNEDELRELREQARIIGRSSSKRLRELFRFSS